MPNPPPPILGSSPALLALRHLLPHLAASPASILLSSEPGTGKSLLATHLHHASPSAHLPLEPFPLDLPTDDIPPSHTLFLLRNPASLSPDRQLRLFRLLHARPHLRLLTLSPSNPLADVASGALRPDLFHRLSEIHLTLPPLRHRPGDLELLALAFLSELATQYAKPFTGIDPPALRRLAAHPFPGNLLELRLLLEPIVALNTGPVLTESMLPPDLGAAMYLGTLNPVPPLPPIPQSADALAAQSPLVSSSALPTTAQAGELLSTSAITPFSDAIIPLADLERRAVEHALRLCNGSLEDAAERLGLSVSALRQKLSLPPTSPPNAPPTPPPTAPP